MYPHTDKFKETTKAKSSSSLNFIIFYNAIGLVLGLFLTIVILCSMKKINQYKVEMLSAFLETT